LTHDQVAQLTKSKSPRSTRSQSLIVSSQDDEPGDARAKKRPPFGWCLASQEEGQHDSCIVSYIDQWGQEQTCSCPNHNNTTEKSVVDMRPAKRKSKSRKV
jgi:hypothetical protein